MGQEQTYQEVNQTELTEMVKNLEDGVMLEIVFTGKETDYEQG